MNSKDRNKNTESSENGDEVLKNKRMEFILNIQFKRKKLHNIIEIKLLLDINRLHTPNKIYFARIITKCKYK